MSMTSKSALLEPVRLLEIRRSIASATLLAALALCPAAVGQEPPSGSSPPQASATDASSDVRSLGALGDGQTDDSAAIQRAVDAGSGAIRFTEGTYRLTKPIVVDLDRVGPTSIVGDGTATILMAGPGPAFKFIGTHEGTAAPNSFEQRVWDRQRTPSVDGIEIVGGHPEAVGIEANGTMQLTLTRLVVREALHAVHLTGRNRNVILSNCHLYHNRGIGVYYDQVNLHQSNIVGCHISYNGGGGVVARGGDVRNIHIGTCDIEGNHAADGPPTANVLIDSAGGTAGIGEVAITGCTIQHNHTSPDSANIRILGLSGTEGTERYREGNVTIADNVLSDVQTNVHLRECRGVTFTGNTLWMAFTKDLLVEKCSNVVIGSNNLDRNPRYAYGDSLDAKGGVIFRGCEDCTVNGLHVNGARRAEAGVLIEDCRRFNVTGCTVLDCDGVGLRLKDVSDSRISDCLIRDDRDEASGSVSIKVDGGRGNMILDNLLGGRREVDPESLVGGDAVRR